MRKIALILCFLLALLFALPARAEESAEDALYLLVNEQNTVITHYYGAPEAGDEYIATDNAHYRVKIVDANRRVATLEALGTYQMPDVSWLEEKTGSLPASAKAKAVAIYCTHSDESYVPTDGTSSQKGQGGIYDVAGALKAALEEKGVTVHYSEDTHHPHDAGAYRRSRATAAELLKNGVDALIDIHRDGIPDPESYDSEVAGESLAMVRLEVGRANQNASVNKAFATRLKAIADKVYPGLVKDIYIGKGTYNQDLSPNAILFEFGTYTNEKQDAEKATAYMADVLYRALYGDVTGAAGASDARQAGSGEKKQGEESRGVWSGILWVIGALVVGAIIYALAATGRMKPALEKTGSTFREMFGGLFGRRKDSSRK